MAPDQISANHSEYIMADQVSNNRSQIMFAD